LPKKSLIINEYANEKTKFQIINNSNSTLDPIIGSRLIVNTDLSQQPIELIKDLNSLLASPNGAYNGLGFVTPSNVLDELVLVYNDSATLGMPNLIQIVSNFFSRMEGNQLIKASIGAMPKLPSQCDSFIFDSSIFIALIVLGFAFIVPVISFATEIVHDKEVYFYYFYILFILVVVSSSNSRVATALVDCSCHFRSSETSIPKSRLQELLRFSPAILSVWLEEGCFWWPTTIILHLFLFS
jgi:hypothetical protein